MQGVILLKYNENVRQIENEEKIKFLINLLDQIGVPVQDFCMQNTGLSIDQKIKLRGLLTTYNIQVIDDLNGNMKVYTNQEMVGEWFKSTYKLKRDLLEIDRNKQLYKEMTVSFWTIFEEQEK